MKYELTDQQVKSLMALISNAQIRGNEAGIIISLIQALSSPVKEKPEVKSKEGGK